MLGSLKTDLARAIEGRTACLFLSGGSDSLLLLNVLLEMKADFAVMTMDATFSRDQHRVIDDLVNKHGITVFGYKPHTAYFVGDGDRLAFIEEYKMLDGTPIPFIRDCTGGGKCSFDVMVETRPDAPIGFEVNIFGTRKTDRHWAWGRASASAEVEMGFGKIICPLWIWTRAQVADALKAYGVKRPTVDTGNYTHCTLCLGSTGQVRCPKTNEMIPAVDWNPVNMLGLFREKFGVKNYATTN